MTVAQLGAVRDATLPVANPYSLVNTVGRFGGLVEEADARWELGVVIDAQPCASIFTMPSYCASDGDGEKDDGADNTPAIVSWEPFTIYAPMTCSSLGQGQGDRLKARAQNHLNAADSTGIEEALEQGVGDNKYLNDSDVVTLGGAAVDLVTAWALLEAAAAAGLGRGGAYLHLPSVLGPLAIRYDLVKESNGVLVSASSGFPVVIGQGYTGSFDSGQSTADMYVTGPVQVRRGPVEMTPDNPAWALDREINVYVFRAERNAVALFDTCVQAKVSVDLSATDTST